MKEIDAIKILKKKGYNISSPVRENGIYLIKYLDEKGNLKYATRKRFNTSHRSTYPSDSKIVFIEFNRLKWESLPDAIVEKC